MRRAVSVLVLCGGLAACQTGMPESNPEFGMGVGDYQTYQQDQADLARARAAREAALTGGAQGTGAPTAQELSAAGIGAPLDPTAQRGGQASGQAAPAPLRMSDFSGGNIVAFALATTHQPGAAVYTRVLASDRRAAAACARFSAPDQAQEAFLRAGGPQRDRRGMDPDGDGFACGWDPRPFRRAVAEPILADEIPPEG